MNNDQKIEAILEELYSIEYYEENNNKHSLLIFFFIWLMAIIPPIFIF